MDSRAPAGNPAQDRVVGGRYRLLSPLGSGGMGTVWRAEDAVLGRHVAVKEVVFPHGLSDDDRATLRERVRREARAAARLDHPSAVTVYDVVEQDGQPWLVLELVEARTLSQVVRTDGPLSPQRTAEVGLAVLGALEAAHRQGIVHRDVKPANVLLGDRSTGSRVVLTDFGIATTAGDPSITSTGLLLGSPSFIAPERARGATPGPPSDLWSLGATLFTAVEGRPPYDRGEPLTTLTAVVTDDRDPYVAAGPLVPVLDGLLTPDPALRLDAGAARRLLQDVAHGRATAVRTDAPVPDPDAERRSEQTAALPLPPVAAPAGPPPVDPPRAASSAAASEPPAARVGGSRSTTRRTALGLAVAVAALAVGAVGYGLTSSGAGRSPASPGASASPADTSSGDGPAALPAGWTAHRGGPGWTAATPASWRVSTFSGFPQYRDPVTSRTLRVSTGPGRPDAVADREQQEAAFARGHEDYQRLRIDPVTYRGVAAADWEFTYHDGGADLHVLNRVLDVDGVGHSLFFQTRAADWEAAQDDLEAVLATFRPAAR